MFRCIQDDGKYALSKLKLSLSDLRNKRGTKSITNKKLLVYLYLRIECGYSWHEIGDYTFKDHTTVLKLVQKHVHLWDKYRHEFTNILIQST